MMDIPNAKEISDLTSLLAPGIVILGLRSRFKDTTPPKLSEKMINYALTSIAYNAASYPIFHAKGWVVLPSWAWQSFLSFVGPAIVGMGLAFIDQSERFYEFARRLGLRPVHHILTAWDHTFRDRQPSYTLFHLTDGSTVAGAWTDGSFASSVSGDRDVFISQLWRIEEDGRGFIEVDPPRSMLICGGSIRMIEFIKGGSDDGQEANDS